jgi:hypothetical protein
MYLLMTVNTFFVETEPTGFGYALANVNTLPRTLWKTLPQTPAGLSTVTDR